MRYFITLDDQEHQLELSRADDGQLAIHAPPASAGAQAEPLDVEILARAPGGLAVVKVGARIFRVALPPANGLRKERELPLRIDGVPVRARIENELERQSTRRAGAAGSKAAQVRAPLPGRVVKLSVQVGDRVAVGAPLLTIEAMKMENEISAPRAGRIARVLVEAGAAVDADAELLAIEDA
jgi:glutaconyl-CoA/methylmalonyl-CoA decarboxylase subunit gamma